MSEYDEHEPVTEILPPTVPENSSLSARMAARAEEIRRHTTEKFPIPGYEEVLEVELHPLGYQVTARIRKRLERIKDEATRELYALSDVILAATVGFWEVDGDDRHPLEDETWITLAKRLPNAPDDPTPRQALLFLVTDQRIQFLVSDWADWVRAVQPDTDEETQEVFVKTG